jgi:hypothetical protein
MSKAISMNEIYRELKPNQHRAQNLIIILWIMLVLEVVALISGYLQYDLLSSVSNGYDIFYDAANVNDLREMIVGIVYTAAYLVSVVLFILWFRGAYYNLHTKLDYLSYSEGWAAGAWFVPIINLYKPYKIMKELYEETKIQLGRNRIAHDGELNLNLPGIWWTLWILNNFVAQIAMRISLNAETIDELLKMTIAGMVSSLIGIPLTLITIKLVNDYAKVEPLLLKLSNEDKMTTSNVQIGNIDTNLLR